MPNDFAVARKALAVLTLALSLAACTSQVAKNPTPVGAVPQRASPLAYTIEPGDDLDIRFFYNPELNEETTVRPDGNISLPLVGEVRAAGRSPADLEATLRDRYSRDLRQAAITVIPKTFAGQRVYVDGEVGQPQMVKLGGGMTALQAVASAGGFKVTARKGETLVIRRPPAPGAQPMVIPLDLGAAIDGSNPGQDLALEPYDVVFVPKSQVAEVNTWIEQYIKNNIPIPFGFGYGIH